MELQANSPPPSESGGGPCPRARGGCRVRTHSGGCWQKPVPTRGTAWAAPGNCVGRLELAAPPPPAVPESQAVGGPGRVFRAGCDSIKSNAVTLRGQSLLRPPLKLSTKTQMSDTYGAARDPPAGRNLGKTPSSPRLRGVSVPRVLDVSRIAGTALRGHVRPRGYGRLPSPFGSGTQQPTQSRSPERSDLRRCQPENAPDLGPRRCRTNLQARRPGLPPGPAQRRC